MNAIIRYRGGLGNQLFQHAYALYLVSKYRHNIVVDVSWYSASRGREADRAFDLSRSNLFSSSSYLFVKNKRISRLARRLSKFLGVCFKDSDASSICKTSNMDRLCADDPEHHKHNFALRSLVLNIISLKISRFLFSYHEGYWQDFRIADSVKNMLLPQLVVSHPSLWYREYAQKVSSEPGFVAVHVRRGDYLKSGAFEILGDTYYEKALEFIAKKQPIDKIYIFSDCIDSCKELSFWAGFNVEFVHSPANSSSSIEELFLMSNFSAIICANSTYSAWAAWIGSAFGSTTNVVAPANWVKQSSGLLSPILPLTWQLL